MIKTIKKPKIYFFKHASIGPLKRYENPNKFITNPKEMCEILKEQYISPYSIPKEEAESPAVGNLEGEVSPALNDIDFTKKYLIVAKQIPVQARMELLQYSSRNWERNSVNH